MVDIIFERARTARVPRKAIIFRIKLISELFQIINFLTERPLILFGDIVRGDDGINHLHRIDVACPEVSLGATPGLRAVAARPEEDGGYNNRINSAHGFFPPRN